MAALGSPLAVLAVALVALAALGAQTPQASIVLYPTGYARVTISAQVAAPGPVNISLIGVPEGLTATYANGSPVPFEIRGGTLRLEPAAAGAVLVSYLTSSIVGKGPSAWYASFSTSYPTELELPRNASLIYASSLPEEIAVSGGSLVLYLAPGNWTVYYELPPPTRGSGGGPLNPYWAAAAAAAIAAALLLGARFGRRRAPPAARGTDSL